MRLHLLVFMALLAAGCATPQPAAQPEPEGRVESPPEATDAPQPPIRLEARDDDADDGADTAPDTGPGASTGGSVGAPKGAPSPRAPPGWRLDVYFVDVGQGDGVVWALPGGGAVVYDCGPPATSADTNPMVKQLRALGLERGATIHALISSHGHLDHIGGCGDIFDEYRVLHVYETWYEGADRPASYERFLQQARAEGAQLHTLRDAREIEGERIFALGERIELPVEAAEVGITARIEWPAARPLAGWRDVASQSIVVRLEQGGRAFCFQGDIGTAQEDTLARAGAPRCDVYLMGHHGSRDASSALWLATIQPRVAIASYGENPYGHPSAEALCRAQYAGASIYATHALGTIRVTTRADGISVNPDVADLRDHCAA